MRLNSIALAALAALALAPAAAVGSPTFGGRAYTEWYLGEPVVAVDSVSQITLGQIGTQIYGKDLWRNSKGLSLDGFTSLRGRQNFASGSTWNPEWFLYQGYLQLARPGRLTVRAGRMFLQSAIKSRLADGFFGAIDLGRRWRLEGFVAAATLPGDPQRIQSLDQELWSGARVRFTQGGWRWAPAAMWEKHQGEWVRQLVGVDGEWGGRGHEASIRYMYNLFVERMDELRLGYSYRHGEAWRAAFRYQVRDPYVTFIESAPSPDSTFVEGARQYASCFLSLSLSSTSRLNVEGNLVTMEGEYVWRYGASLRLNSFQVRYERRDGYGPVFDRIVAAGRRQLHPGWNVGISGGLTQYRLDPTRESLEQTAAFATLDLVWQPTPLWAVTMEGQALGNDLADYDARLYSRLEYRFGEGR